MVLGPYLITIYPEDRQRLVKLEYRNFTGTGYLRLSYFLFGSGMLDVMVGKRIVLSLQKDESLKTTTWSSVGVKINSTNETVSLLLLQLFVTLVLLYFFTMGILQRFYTSEHASSVAGRICCKGTHNEIKCFNQLDIKIYIYKSLFNVVIREVVA
jgi:hypothetical protein